MKLPILRIALVLAAFLTAVQAMAQVGPDGDMPKKASKSRCPKVAFSVVEKPQAMGRSFSAADATDLIIHVLFDRTLEEEHVVTLEVFTPKGHLYRRFEVPLAPAHENPSESTRRLPGYPYPVPVHEPKTVEVGGSKFQSVEVVFPVAGSSIVTSSLYGRWNVEVYLDRDAEACGRRTFFHLKD
jgi:hypothetical protein